MTSNLLGTQAWSWSLAGDRRLSRQATVTIESADAVLVKGARKMTAFDWHSGEITRATPITKSYRSTQKVRRFFKGECGDGFKFDRAFMAWLKTAAGQTMGDAVDEWHRREAMKRISDAR